MTGMGGAAAPTRMLRTPGGARCRPACCSCSFHLRARASAQVSGTTATLRGSVEDASGGVLPGATVTLVNSGTSAIRTAITDERGAFTFSSVFPGTYDLRCELAGFKTTEQEGISLSPNDYARHLHTTGDREPERGCHGEGRAGRGDSNRDGRA